MPGSDRWPYIECVVVSFVLAVVLTAVMRWLSPRIGMVDHPGERKNHSRVTPLLGGVAVYLATVGSYAVLAGMDSRTLWLVGGALGVVVLGVIDDRIGLRARFRLGVQLLAAIGIVASGARFDWFPWAPANYAVSIVWLVGLMNAINCLDCADGIAPGVSAIGAAAFFLIAVGYGHFAVALMAIALLGACVGFLTFNFPPASIFLGDSGSTFLGFMLGALAIASTRTAAPVQQAWIAALPVGLVIWDITVVHARRYFSGTRGVRSLLESAGLDHLPHRLQELGLNPRQVASAAYLMAVVFAVPAIAVARYGVGSLILAVEVVFIGLVSGERPFGVLVGRLSRVARPARSARRAAAVQSEAGGAVMREAPGLSAAAGRSDSLGGGS